MRTGVAPCQPNVTPEAWLSQCGVCAAFQYGRVSRRSLPTGSAAASRSSAGSGAPAELGSPNCCRNHVGRYVPDELNVSTVVCPGIAEIIDR